MTDRPTSDIAVVVATHNRAPLLPRLVSAFEGQDFDGAFEVLVVDDGSTDGTWSELQRLAASARFDLRPIHVEENAGPAAARNRGWRAASAPMIAFTDDDCVPAPGWLRAIRRGLEGADLVQGTTLPDPAREDTLGPFGHTIRVTEANGHWETCNMGYRRSVLEAQGGFDEEFRFPMGEDVDLGIRSQEAGAQSAFLTDAVVYHDVADSNFRNFLRKRRQREGFAVLCREHPALRRELTLGIFTHLTATMTAAAALGAAARPRNPLTWLAFGGLAAKYARQIVRDTVPPANRRDWRTVVPMHFIADLYEVAVMARASIRHRTLVL